MEYRTIKDLDKAIKNWASDESKNLKVTYTFLEELIGNSIEELKTESKLAKTLLTRAINSSGIK